MEDEKKKRLWALRNQMAERGIDMYVIPTSDFHQSEYVGEYFKVRKYITGFTGSAGTAVILKDEAGLWTDGRYFIQAAHQLEGSGITLYRIGEEGVPKIEEFIEKKLKKGGCIGFDGRTMDAKTGAAYKRIAKKKGGRLFTEEDLAGKIWENRPNMKQEAIFLLEESYAGRNVRLKLGDVRKKMKELGADVHLLSSLYDIAWLLNVRGQDIPHVPVVMSYLVIGTKTCTWFVREEILTEAQREYLAENEIAVMPYESVYDFVSSIEAGAVLYEESKINYRLMESLPQSVKKICAKNPTELLKAVKNPVEIANTLKAHIKDGVAVTKFMHYLKTCIGKEEMTELSAAEYLKERRKEQEHFLDVSFETICAYGKNAAMMHYEATPENFAVLKPEGFLLADSGGHYLEGTTDITRTMALGPVTDEMKQHFTAVLKANLNLSSAKFLSGCRGIQLDLLAREHLWRMGLDYQCGTGHGVGHLLNVHEGPNAFHWKWREEGEQGAVLEEGMITTNEPGIYLEGKYGIRIENELLCKKAEKNEYGQFLCLEEITFAPIDLDAIDQAEMTKRERELLNAYHKKVFQTLSPYLTEEENLWLKEYTREI